MILLLLSSQQILAFLPIAVELFRFHFCCSEWVNEGTNVQVSGANSIELRLTTTRTYLEEVIQSPLYYEVWPANLLSA
jgi:hypothetical protein